MVQNLAPKLTWDEIHTLAKCFVGEWYAVAVTEDKDRKSISDTLKRMGYKGGLSEDTYYEMNPVEDDHVG